MTWYVSFGSGHRRTLDRMRITQEGVVKVDADDEATARRLVERVFGSRWSSLYAEDDMVWQSSDGHPYFPAGVVAVLTTSDDGWPALTHGHGS